MNPDSYLTSIDVYLPKINEFWPPTLKELGRL